MGYDMRTGEGRYFRVSASGMAALLTWMDRHGMLATGYGASEMPAYVPPEAVMSAEEASRDAVQRQYELSTGWRPARWNHSIRRFVPLPGIAYHKLCSNDWWYITAEECREALDAWERSEEPNREAWPDWVEYLRAAVDETGILVW